MTMDIKALFGKALTLADAVNEFLPASGLTQGAINLARGAEDLIGSFGDDIPLEKQAEAQEVRKALAAKVKAKAAATSARLRG